MHKNYMKCQIFVVKCISICILQQKSDISHLFDAGNRIFDTMKKMNEERGSWIETVFYHKHDIAHDAYSDFLHGGRKFGQSIQLQ